MLLGRYENDALTSLRKSEGTSVDDSIRPSVTKALNGCYDVVHRTTTVEPKHVTDVLQDQPLRCRATIGEQPKDLVDEAGLGAINA